MKYLLIFLFLFLNTVSNVFADSEEDACFDILVQKVKLSNANKWPNLDQQFYQIKNNEDLRAEYVKFTYNNFLRLFRAEYKDEPKYRFTNNFTLNGGKRWVFRDEMVYVKNLRNSDDNEGGSINNSLFRDSTNGKAVMTYDDFYTDGMIRKSRRNNIGTIILWSNYIQTQYITFWLTTNFQFPYSPEEDASNGISTMGDVYSSFHETVVYTHHLLDGTFLSCGYIKLRPPSNPQTSTTTGYNIWLKNNMASSNYLTNVISVPSLSSWFELWDKPLIQGGHQFLVWHVNVPGIDVEQNPLLNLEVVTVAYNNKSSYFNEYETFPYQVKVMTNPDAQKSLNDLQTDFLKEIVDNTCLAALHPTNTSLPEKCNGNPKSLSFNTPRFTLADLIIPTAYARLDSIETSFTGAMPRGIYFDAGLTFELSQKIDLIPHAEFRDYLRMALSPYFIPSIEKKKQKNIILTPYEETLYNCPIGYNDRFRIITGWLEKIDPTTIDPYDINWPDPRIGDCVMPYPDKTHRDIFLTGSFPSNQLYAQIKNGTITWTTDVWLINTNPNGVDFDKNQYKSTFFQKILGWFLLLIGFGIGFLVLRKKSTPTV